MKKSLAAVVLILITLVLCGTHRQRRIAKTFEDSAFGTLQSDAVKQLGAPWKTASCGQTFGGEVPLRSVTVQLLCFCE